MTPPAVPRFRPLSATYWRQVWSEAREERRALPTCQKVFGGMVAALIGAACAALGMTTAESIFELSPPDAARERAAFAAEGARRLAACRDVRATIAGATDWATIDLNIGLYHAHACEIVLGPLRPDQPEQN